MSIIDAKAKVMI